MVCLGLKPGAAGWKVQTNPLSYGGTPKIFKNVNIKFIHRLGKWAKINVSNSLTL